MKGISLPRCYILLPTQGMEGARGIEPPPGFADRAYGFEARGAPSTIAPESAKNTERAKARRYLTMSLRKENGEKSSALPHPPYTGG